MKLRDALGMAPGSAAHNPQDAGRWGIMDTLTAKRLADGGVHLSAYLGEGDWYARDYPDADAAGVAPFIDKSADEDSQGRPVARFWRGEDDWQPGERQPDGWGEDQEG